MSTQASHSMHSGGENTVCTSAVQAALRFGESHLRVESELDLDLDALQRNRLIL